MSNRQPNQPNNNNNSNSARSSGGPRSWSAIAGSGNPPAQQQQPQQPANPPAKSNNNAKQGNNSRPPADGTSAGQKKSQNNNNNGGSISPTVSAASQQVQGVLSKLTEPEKQTNRVAFLHLLFSMIGKEVNLELTDGTALTGVLHTNTLFTAQKLQGLRFPNQVIVLKSSKLVKAGKAPKQFESGAMLIIDYKDISSFSATVGELHHRSISAELRTDSSIKKHGDMSHLVNRDLQGVSDAWLDPTKNTSLASGGNKVWDQFEANKRLFNVQSTFDENLYTKKIDKEKISAESLARAERLAREIEQAQSSNIHLLEERGQLAEQDMDEEAMYSGVIREDYQAPAVAAISAAAPASGASSSNWRKPAENAWKAGGANKIIAANAPATKPVGQAAPVAQPAPTAPATSNKPNEKKPAQAVAAPPQILPVAQVEAKKASSTSPTINTDSAANPPVLQFGNFSPVATAAPATMPGLTKTASPSVEQAQASMKNLSLDASTSAPPGFALSPNSNTSASAAKTAATKPETAVVPAVPVPASKPVVPASSTSEPEKKATSPAPAADAEKTLAKEEPKQEEKKPVSSSLNPNAKTFTFNPKAQEWKPTSAASSLPPVPPMQPVVLPIPAYVAPNSPPPMTMNVTPVFPAFGGPAPALVPTTLVNINPITSSMNIAPPSTQPFHQDSPSMSGKTGGMGSNSSINNAIRSSPHVPPNTSSHNNGSNSFQLPPSSQSFGNSMLANQSLMTSPQPLGIASPQMTGNTGISPYGTPGGLDMPTATATQPYNYIPTMTQSPSMDLYPNYNNYPYHGQYTQQMYFSTPVPGYSENYAMSNQPYVMPPTAYGPQQAYGTVSMMPNGQGYMNQGQGGQRSQGRDGSNRGSRSNNPRRNDNNQGSNNNNSGNQGGYNNNSGNSQGAGGRNGPSQGGNRYNNNNGGYNSHHQSYGGYNGGNNNLGMTGGYGDDGSINNNGNSMNGDNGYNNNYGGGYNNA